MTPLDKARHIFANDRYATQTTGINIEAVADHSATCLLTITPDHCNARHMAMGGVLYTLADFAAAIAANTDCLESEVLQWVSLNATAHFLAPVACHTPLQAHCTSLKQGRTTALYQTRIEDTHSGRCVAIVESTMIHL